MRKSHVHAQHVAHRLPRREGCDATDQMLEHCANLQTLARLLEQFGDRGSEDQVEAQVVANTGGLIAREAQRLRDLLERA